MRPMFSSVPESGGKWVTPRPRYLSHVYPPDRAVNYALRYDAAASCQGRRSRRRGDSADVAGTATAIAKAAGRRGLRRTSPHAGRCARSARLWQEDARRLQASVGLCDDVSSLEPSADICGAVSGHRRLCAGLRLAGRGRGRLLRLSVAALRRDAAAQGIRRVDDRCGAAQCANTCRTSSSSTASSPNGR